MSEDHTDDPLPYTGGLSLVRIHKNCDNVCVKLVHSSVEGIPECHQHFDPDAIHPADASADMQAAVHKQYLEHKYRRVAVYNQYLLSDDLIQVKLDAPWSDDPTQTVVLNARASIGSDRLRQMLTVPWRVKKDSEGRLIPFTDGGEATMNKSVRMVDWLYPGRGSYGYRNNNTMDLRQENVTFDVVILPTLKRQIHAEEPIAGEVLQPPVVKRRKLSKRSKTGCAGVWHHTDRLTGLTAFRTMYTDGTKWRCKYIYYTDDNKDAKWREVMAFAAAHQQAM